MPKKKVVIPQTAAEAKVDALTLHEKLDICLNSLFTGGLILRSIKESGNILVYDRDTGVYVEGGEATISNWLQKHLPYIMTNTVEREILGNIRRDRATPFASFDSDPDLLCTRNGILNIRTREFSNHNPAVLFLRGLGATYDPDADCPAIRTFLSQVVAPQDIALMQEFCGFTLISGYPYHKAFILVGTGDNGKTTWVKVLKSFLGANNYSSLTLQQMCHDKFLLYRLVGKLVNLASEMGSDAVRSPDSLKGLCGDDSLTFDKKHRDPFDAVNTAKMLFACNNTPPAPDGDKAYYGRFIVIPFPRTFTAGKDLIPDLDLTMSTDAELSGLLNFALDGHDKLVANECFSYNKDYKATQLLYQAWSGSSIHRFVATNVALDPVAVISERELWDAYCDFCMINDLATESEKSFFTEFPRAVGGRLVKFQAGISQTRSYRGVRMAVTQFEDTVPHSVSIRPRDMLDD